MSPLSKTENKVLMTQARESLRGKWGLAAGTSFVYVIILAFLQVIPVLGWIASTVIAGPMMIGLTLFMLSISRKQNVALPQIFDGFQKFSVGFGAYCLMGLFVLLWALLLIVPGIIAALSYSLTYFIIVDDGSIRPLQAITKSKEMMQGNKWKLFCLFFRFFGWALLCILTCGIGLFWLIPYIMVSTAKFYDEIKIQQDGGFIAPQPTPTVDVSGFIS
jgi:Predicted integral membrane protein